MTNFGAYDITKTAEFQEELALQRTFMNKVYAWMAAGLVITTLGSLLVAGSQELRRVFIENSQVRIGMLIAWIAVSLVLIFGQRKLPAPAAAVLFLVYSALVGVTTGALVLVVYEAGAVASAFITTAGMFLAMSVWGYTTKKDLTGLGSFMMMGLFGLIIAMFVSMIFGGPNKMMAFVINVVGVIVFTGLTAYDTQKIKQSYAVGEAGGAIYKKAAVYGAFMLYLDFVNLFLYLVQLFGKRD